MLRYFGIPQMHCCAFPLIRFNWKCLLLMISTADGRWPDLVGRDAEEAKTHILTERPNLNVQIVVSGMMTTMDYNTNRVRLFVDNERKVVKCPTIGWCVEKHRPRWCISLFHQRRNVNLGYAVRSGNLLLYIVSFEFDVLNSVLRCLVSCLIFLGFYFQHIIVFISLEMLFLVSSV